MIIGCGPWRVGQAFLVNGRESKPAFREVCGGVETGGSF